VYDNVRGEQPTATPTLAEPTAAVEPAALAETAIVENTAVPTATPEPTQTPLPSPTPIPPGPPDRIEIPVIMLDAPIRPMPLQRVTIQDQMFEQWMAPAEYAAGWQEGSAEIGAQGNTVLNGHHNIYGSVFSHLRELIQGDSIVVYSGENAHHYVVSQVMILEERSATIEQRQENARWVLPSEDERLTLVTCWPPESNTHRLIVVAVPTGN
jgi:sortase A